MSNKQKSRVGRPPLYKNEKERAEAKRRQNKKAQERVQRRRKELYRNNPKYRARILAENRKRYRQRNNIRLKRFGRRRGDATKYASFRMVGVGGELVSKATLDSRQMAEFLEITTKAFSCWLRTGKVPWPKLKSDDGDRVFTVAQANAIASALYDCLEGKATYRATDEVTVSSVHQAYLSNKL